MIEMTGWLEGGEKTKFFCNKTKSSLIYLISYLLGPLNADGRCVTWAVIVVTVSGTRIFP